MRRACIDIGSNTTRLLVADAGETALTPVHEERAFTRIGVALAGRDTIPDAKRAEVIDVVRAQLAVARGLGAREVHGVATAAIRRAGDGARFAEELEARCGLALRILSDREEAHLAFAGAAGMFQGSAPEPLGVLDVGGGSSEVVVGAAGGAIAWWTSLAVGSGVLAHHHFAHDPPSAAELRAAGEEATAIVAGIAPPPMAAAVAVGGSATTLGRLTGPRLDETSLRAALALLVAGPSADVARRHHIDPDRARLLPAGLVILEALRPRLGTELTVGRGGIREGVLLQAEMR
jgi:exopolyphosphatase/guanosine-5'-triphosphate,3'-diphosphate pyrophosphatase